MFHPVTHGRVHRVALLQLYDGSKCLAACRRDPRDGRQECEANFIATQRIEHQSDGDQRCRWGSVPIVWLKHPEIHGLAHVVLPNSNANGFLQVTGVDRGRYIVQQQRAFVQRAVDVSNVFARGVLILVQLPVEPFPILRRVAISIHAAK